MSTSFYFGGRVSNLLFEGWSIATAKDLGITLLAIGVAVFIIEGIRRISRECWRKVPKPPRSGHVDHGKVKMITSDGVPLARYTSQMEKETNITKESSPCLETAQRNRTVKTDVVVSQGEQCGTPCCSLEAGRMTDTHGSEIEPFVNNNHSAVEQPPCCVQDEELSVEKREARIQTMWRSLSLEFLSDRWDILQGTSNDKGPTQKRITRRRRLVFHVLQTVLSMGQLAIGYVIMLVVMTYNAWFLIVVVGGAGLGYLVLSRDLERLYANYASDVLKQKAKEAAKRKSCVRTPPCRLSWNKIQEDPNQETLC